MDGGIKDLHKCGEEMSKNSPLPSQEQQEQVSWMARAGGEGRDKGAKAFCPGWRHQPGQKGGLLSRLVAPTGTKCCAGLLSRLKPPTGIKGHPVPPAGPASRWTRDKSHLLSRAQRLPGQMVRNKGLFCSSDWLPTNHAHYFVWNNILLISNEWTKCWHDAHNDAPKLNTIVIK